MKKKALLIAVVAIALAVVTAASVTVAWLTAESNEVTNTFTYGDIQIELWETDLEGKKTSEGVTFAGVIPGDEVSKDPTITVKEVSEKCYVYVLITNNLVLADKSVSPVAEYNIDAASWTKVQDIGTNSVLYRYNSTVDPSTDTSNDGVDVGVFTTVTFSKALSSANVRELENITEGIVIKAYAHQAEHAELDDANTAAITWATTNAN